VSAGRALVLKVNTERFPGLAAQFNVRNIPNFALFSEGHLQFQQAGLVDASRMEGWIARAC
jgi:thioredoxin 2